MNSKLNTVLYGGPLQYPLNDVQVIMGTGTYQSGTLMDANKIYETVKTEIQKLIGDAPGGLDSLYELAEALNKDPMLIKNMDAKLNHLLTEAVFITGDMEITSILDAEEGITINMSIPGIQWDSTANEFRDPFQAVIGTLDIPLVSHTNNGVISKEDKKKLDAILDDYYGISWNTDDDGIVTSGPVRIGNMTWHRTLPIQSQMKRCTLKQDGTVNGYISDDDWTKYTDGRTVKYDGTDGDVMVDVPEYYYEASSTKTETGYTNELKLYPFVKRGRLSKRVYISAAKAMSDLHSKGNVSSAKLYSMCQHDAVYNGNEVEASSLGYPISAYQYLGGSRAEKYNTTNENSLLGRQLTYTNIANLRQMARNKGSQWSLLHWTAWEAVKRLYVVEYCNFNSQATYSDTLTTEGYKTGGLGESCTNINWQQWTLFNDNNPLTPALITKTLGNHTGVIKFKYSADVAGLSSVTTSMESYRGIEEVFGNTWCFCDGAARYGDATTKKSKFYVCENINKFTNISGNVPQGYNVISDDFPYRASATNQNIKAISWNERGEFIPKLIDGANSAAYFDSLWLSGGGWFITLLGGRAGNSSAAGLLALAVSDDFGHANAWCGSRLLYNPQ